MIRQMLRGSDLHRVPSVPGRATAPCYSAASVIGVLTPTKLGWRGLSQARVSKRWAAGWILSIVGRMCRRMAFLCIRSEDIFFYRMIRIGRQRNAACLYPLDIVGARAPADGLGIWRWQMIAIDWSLWHPHPAMGGSHLAFGTCGNYLRSVASALPFGIVVRCSVAFVSQLPFLSASFAL